MRTLRTLPSPTVSLALLALLVLPGCRGRGASAPERPGDPGWLVAHGRYEEAVKVAGKIHERRPDDAEAEEQYRLASVALLLDRGRELLFADRDEEALEMFHEAERLAPESEIVRQWIDSTRQKLADHWSDIGVEWHMRDNLEEAVTAYEKARTFIPGDSRATQGIARALVQMNYREGMGKTYYDNAVQALDSYFLNRALWRFNSSLKYSPKNDRAEKRGRETQTLLASDRVAIGRLAEEAGRWAAARNEYRLALLLDEGHPEAAEGLARARREEEAKEHLREFQRRLLKKEFDLAERELEAGSQITQFQQADFDQARTELEEARLEVAYTAARTLESDFRYPEAIAAYEKLLETAPFFRDAITRKETLKSYVEEAARLYADYQAAQHEQARLALLRQIDVFWPEYEDVQERLAELEKGAPAAGDRP